MSIIRNKYEDNVNVLNHVIFIFLIMLCCFSRFGAQAPGLGFKVAAGRARAGPLPPLSGSATGTGPQKCETNMKWHEQTRTNNVIVHFQLIFIFIPYLFICSFIFFFHICVFLVSLGGQCRVLCMSCLFRFEDGQFANSWKWSGILKKNIFRRKNAKSLPHPMGVFWTHLDLPRCQQGAKVNFRPIHKGLEISIENPYPTIGVTWLPSKILATHSFAITTTAFFSSAGAPYVAFFSSPWYVACHGACFCSNSGKISYRCHGPPPSKGKAEIPSRHVDSWRDFIKRKSPQLWNVLALLKSSRMPQAFFFGNKCVPEIFMTCMGPVEVLQAAAGAFVQQKWRSYDFMTCISPVEVFPAAAGA